MVEEEREKEEETDEGKRKDDSKPEESSFWTFLMDYSGVFLIIFSRFTLLAII